MQTPLRVALAAAAFALGLTPAMADVITLACDNLSAGATYQIDLSRGIIILRDPTTRGADGGISVETQPAQINDQSVKWRRHFPNVYTQDFTLDRLSATLKLLFTPYHIGGQQSHHSHSCRRVSGEKLF